MFGNDNQPKILGETEIMELKKKHGIVLFYMDGCGHCEIMKPAWNKVVEELKDKHKDEIILGAVESSSMEMFKKHGIHPAVSGFPTILYFPPGRYNTPVHYKGDRSYEDLKNWILTKKGKGKKGSNNSIVILTNTNNKNAMGMGMGMGKTKGLAQTGGGHDGGGNGARSRTKKRTLLMKRQRQRQRRSQKRHKTSTRKNKKRHSRY